MISIVKIIPASCDEDVTYLGNNSMSKKLRRGINLSRGHVRMHVTVSMSVKCSFFVLNGRSAVDVDFAAVAAAAGGGLARKVGGGTRVDDQSGNSRYHRDKSAKRKLPPRVLFQARRRQALKRVRQDVDKSGGKNNAGGERLDYKKQISLRAERRNGGFSEHRKGNAEGAGN